MAANAGTRLTPVIGAAAQISTERAVAPAASAARRLASAAAMPPSRSTVPPASSGT